MFFFGDVRLYYGGAEYVSTPCFFWVRFTGSRMRWDGNTMVCYRSDYRFVNRNPVVAGTEGSRTPYKALLREPMVNKPRPCFWGVVP